MRDDRNMADGGSGPVERPRRSRGRWTSFVADAPPSGRPARALHQEDKLQHRVRVEHDNHTLLIHISDEEGATWTTLALDRETRGCAVAQRENQLEAAKAACRTLYSSRERAMYSPPATRRFSPRDHDR